MFRRPTGWLASTLVSLSVTPALSSCTIDHIYIKADSWGDGIIAGARPASAPTTPRSHSVLPQSSFAEYVQAYRELGARLAAERAERAATAAADIGLSQPAVQAGLARPSRQLLLSLDQQHAANLQSSVELLTQPTSASSRQHAAQHSAPSNIVTTPASPSVSGSASERRQAGGVSAHRAATAGAPHSVSPSPSTSVQQSPRGISTPASPSARHPPSATREYMTSLMHAVTEAAGRGDMQSRVMQEHVVDMLTNLIDDNHHHPHPPARNQQHASGWAGAAGPGAVGSWACQGTPNYESDLLFAHSMLQSRLATCESLINAAAHGHAASASMRAHQWQQQQYPAVHGQHVPQRHVMHNPGVMSRLMVQPQGMYQQALRAQMLHAQHVQASARTEGWQYAAAVPPMQHQFMQ